MSSDVTVRVTDVVVRSAETDVVVRSTGPVIVAAGGSGPAGPVWSGHYGSFYGSDTQTLGAANTAQAVAFTGSHGASGISIVSGSRLTLAHVGTYAMTFVAHVSNYANDTEAATFWIRVNGNDYPNSALRMDLQKRKSEGVPFSELATITFVGTSTTPNDYVEIWWLASSTDVKLYGEPVSVSPVYPASPAVLVGFGQVA